jgi:phosphoglycolate phosphatase-like HAD superfamily hydrolase
MISALIFDKDGTLFDFTATWSGWARAALRDLSGGIRRWRIGLRRRSASTRTAGSSTRPRP